MSNDTQAAPVVTTADGASDQIVNNTEGTARPAVGIQTIGIGQAHRADGNTGVGRKQRDGQRLHKKTVYLLCFNSPII